MSQIQTFHQALQRELAKAVVGQRDSIRLLTIAIATGGHVLIEGVPGVAKTLLARAAAKALDLQFRRVQFTPDLMPSDILGTQVFDFGKGSFHFVEGPIFTQVFLADEINRSPGKTQAALLEAMQELQISVEGASRALQTPFFVVATQNPVEQEGTYPLPEAQLDRFLFKINVEYPSAEEEIAILERNPAGSARMQDLLQHVEAIEHEFDFDAIQSELGTIHIEEPVRRYTAELVRRTRADPRIELGASPRAGIMLQNAACCAASIEGRDFVLPDDIKSLLLPTLRHRVGLTASAEVEGLAADSILLEIADGLAVPR
jgi:MoxR-like ATPase